MRVTKNWKLEFEQTFGCQCGLKGNEALKDYVWATHCSRTKPIKEGYPKDMYRGVEPIRFYDYVEKNGFRYGVLSDKYGIHLDNEILAYYNIHPNRLSIPDKALLAIRIAKKISRLGFNQLIFWGPAPSHSVPYLQILMFSKLRIVYITHFPKA